VKGSAQGEEHAFGVTPRFADLNWNGLNFSQADYRQLTHTHTTQWTTELGLHSELFQQLAHHLPAEMTAVKAAMERRLAA
jgi:phosphoenolpyruvate carboxykinase (GTP)